MLRATSVDGDTEARLRGLLFLEQRMPEAIRVPVWTKRSWREWQKWEALIHVVGTRTKNGIPRTAPEALDVRDFEIRRRHREEKQTIAQLADDFEMSERRIRQIVDLSASRTDTVDLILTLHANGETKSHIAFRAQRSTRTVERVISTATALRQNGNVTPTYVASGETVFSKRQPSTSANE